MTKLTIKPDPSCVGQHIVSKDGEAIAKFWFNRDRIERQGRVTITHSGKLTDLRSGEVIDIGHYCWFVDVKKDMAWLLGLEEA